MIKGKMFNDGYDKYELIAEKKGYTIIGKFVNYKETLKVKCDDCNEISIFNQARYIFTKRHKVCCGTPGGEKYTKKEFNNIMFLKGFVTTDYKGLNSKVTVNCINCDLKKCISAKKALKTKCQKCKKTRSNKYTIKDIIKYCNDHGFKFLDDKFISTLWFHNFECPKGHIIHKEFYHLRDNLKRHNGCGCYECGLIKHRVDFSFVQKQFKIKNLEILEENYEGVAKRSLTTCLICGYAWKADISRILSGDCVCMGCGKRNEHKTLDYLRKLLPDITIKSHKHINEKIYFKKELIKNYILVDFYFEKDNNKYIVEYNGNQHYKPVKFNINMSDEEADKNFRIQIIRDKWLRKYCKNNNIILIEIDGRRYKQEKINNYLKDNYFS